MLEKYFVDQDFIGRVRRCWLAEPIEIYIHWLSDCGYCRSTVRRRVYLLEQFSHFAAASDAKDWFVLAQMVVPFAEQYTKQRRRSASRKQAAVREISGVIFQMLRLLPGCSSELGKAPGKQRVIPPPSFHCANQFILYLKEERGLAVSTVRNYEYWLGRFDQFLLRTEQDLTGLSPSTIRAFIENVCEGQPRSTNVDACGALRVFLRYLYRERIVSRDFSAIVESPRMYALSDIPRGVSWHEVKKILEVVDRTTLLGKRDFAILTLLSVYGLRAREVAALTLSDIDWKHDRLYVPFRKAGHSNAYPLSEIVGSAILEYIKNGRPNSSQRNIFIRAMAPRIPLRAQEITRITSKYIRLAHISVSRPGSHTLRHSCAQRLLECDFPLQAIGDYLGHRSQQSTRIYTKVHINALRSLALGDGEEII